MKTKLWHFPLESYAGRYTEFLGDWTTRAYSDAGFEVITIVGDLPPLLQLTPGRALNPALRVRWACTQAARFAERLGEVSSGDVLHFSDLFHPGYDGIVYALNILGKRPIIAMRNCAQSIDCYDFTFPHRKWMRKYEELVNETASVIFFSSREHGDLMRVANLDKPLLAGVGLPFHRRTILDMVGGIAPRERRERKVVWSSRWDPEKQPAFMLAVALALEADGFQFVCCTANSSLGAWDRTEFPSNVTVLRNCTKQKYYAHLATASVHLLTSLQDWTSNVLIEASAVNTPSAVPAFRGFLSESLLPQQFYLPWQVESAANVIRYLAKDTSTRWTFVADYHHNTLFREAEILKSLVENRR